MNSKEGQGRSVFNSPTFGNPLSLRVDESVGSMSISPSGRDVVLASRTGLFVIDLDDPFTPPRWIQHLTSWEVADVQWSPHAAKAEWVISTSNQKAMVWNLARESKKALQQFLHGHNRAITDINFHPFEPESLATCSVDTFVHTWDLRTPQKPVGSFADWFAGASQVKWSRTNSNVLASSHGRRLNIWDKRMGSQPMFRIQAHQGKVNCIDFHRSEPYKLVTASTDGTVKFWNFSQNTEGGYQGPTDGWKTNYSYFLEPEITVDCGFPVSKARHTPFGSGCAIMPLRGGENSVHIMNYQNKEGNVPMDPVYTYRGHGDVVREFLWRARGGLDQKVDDREFQLVTWSKDRDLRLWPSTPGLESRVNFVRGEKPVPYKLTRRGAPYVTYTHEPVGTESFPVGGVGLGGRRSGLSVSPSHGSFGGNMGIVPATTTMRTKVRSSQGKRNMHLSWLSGVRVGAAAFASHYGSFDEGVGIGGSLVPTSLGEEVSCVGKTFPKVRFEKISVSTGQVVVSLNGQLDENEPDKLTFLRIIIKFPHDYPYEPPTYFIEENEELTKADIKLIKTNLNRISSSYTDHGRFCLEPCLRFLMGEFLSIDEALYEEHTSSEDGSDISDYDDYGHDVVFESDDASAAESDGVFGSSSSDDGIMPMARLGKNSFNSTPIPKGCGAVWSRGGMLVCFFTHRKDDMAHTQRKIETNMKISHMDGSDSESDDSQDSLQNAVWPRDAKFRTSLVPRALNRRVRSSAESDTQRSFGTSPKLLSTNVIKVLDFRNLIPSRKILAQGYEILGLPPHLLCRHNAAVAEKNGYEEASDAWKILELIVDPTEMSKTLETCTPGSNLIPSMSSSNLASHMMPVISSNSSDGILGDWGNHPFGRNALVARLFDYFEKQHNTQMLANMSCVMSSVHQQEQSELNVPQTPGQLNFVRSPGFPPGEHSSNYFLKSPVNAEAWDIPEKRKKRSGSRVIDISPFGSQTSNTTFGSPEWWKRSIARPSSRDVTLSRTDSAFFSRDQSYTPSSDDNIDFSGLFTPLLHRQASIVLSLAEEAPDYPKMQIEFFPTLQDSSPVPLLDPAREDKFQSYRMQYASILASWGLTVESLEVLKFNNRTYNSLFGEIKSAQIGLYAKQPSQVVKAPQRSVHFKANPNNNKECAFCSVTVQGRFFFCVVCEHITHAACAAEWWQNGLGQCPAGCGCECMEHSIAQAEVTCK
ncbi:Maintenance of telomere capping protein 5 [Yarrowia sp. B02]|nr:Maintenance of telomere capping protein 5 [Yarrowia sp. B02]